MSDVHSAGSLAGERVPVTGAAGFMGKVLVESRRG